MWIIFTALGLIAAAIVVVAVAASRRPDAPKRLRQRQTTTFPAEDLPEPGSGESARLDDGDPVPGSEEYRNQHGQS